MATEIQGICWHCGRELSVHYYGREESCPGCRKATRVCRNCRWYAPGRANDCAEPMAERVMEKERANFCSFFEPTSELKARGADVTGDDLRQAAEDLFKF